MLKRIVIIGGGTAGASAAFSARKHDRSAEITVIDKEPYSTYSRCGLPFAIKGVISPIGNLVVFAPKVFASQKITQKLSTEVTEINHQKHEIIYKNVTNNETRPNGLSSGQADKLNYDSLIFATGSTPSKPPIAGIPVRLDDASRSGGDGKWLDAKRHGAAAPNVFVLRSIDDAKNIIQFVSAKGGSASGGKSVVIIGASFIGLEVAEALKHLGLDVSVIEQKYLLWRMLDKEISQMVRQRLTIEGIKLVEDKSISDLNEYKDSLVVISTGVRPSVKLAHDMGVEIGITGGIKVDKNFRTNLPKVYAVGDCAEGLSELTGGPIVIGLGTIAARQGVVAGANAAGASQTAPIILNASVLKLLDLEIGSVGLTEDTIHNPQGVYLAGTSHIDPVFALIKYPSLPYYYPSGTDVHIKLIADKETRRIVGGQVLCKSGAALRVDMISLAIQNKMTVQDILKSDFCYSPPVTDVWEPIMIAAQALAARLNRT